MLFQKLYIYIYINFLYLLICLHKTKNEEYVVLLDFLNFIVVMPLNNDFYLQCRNTEISVKVCFQFDIFFCLTPFFLLFLFSYSIISD